MAFIVEDGTGVADANSLCAVDFADSYFTDRGNAAWTGADAAKQGALVRATDYVEQFFSARFKGNKAEDDQSLSWPRIYAGADDTVPVGVRKAIAEYALRALTATLAPDPTTDASGRIIAAKTEKVGPIEESTTFIEGSSVQLIKNYPAADALLKPWLRSSNGLVRA